MKVILTGSTGFIGAEVLKQALAHPSITSVIALSRKDLPITNPKLQTVIIKDFSSYTSSVLSQLEGAEACVWSLGVKIADLKIQRQVTLDYTRDALEAFAQLKSSKPFRFVFTSGFLAERNLSKFLWFMGDARRIKGEAETILLDYASEHKERLDSYIARPGGVLQKGSPLTDMVGHVFPSVRVVELAAAMVDVAINGGEVKVLENVELVRRGKEVLRK